MPSSATLQFLLLIGVVFHHVQASPFIQDLTKPNVHYPADPILMFQDMGHFHVVESYIHFRIPVPFKNFLDGINARISHIIQEKNQADHAIKTSGFKTIINTIFDQGIRRLNLLESKFLNMMDTLPQQKLSNKRFLDIFGAFLGGAALSMATYNNIKISQLDTDIQKLSASHDLLVDITQVHNEHLKEVDAKLNQVSSFWRDYFTISPALLEEMITDYHNEMLDRFLTLQDTVDQATDGKLSRLLFPPEVGDSIFKKVKAIAANINAHIPIREPADLFHQDISYLFDSKTFNFTLIVHIPVTPKHLVFKIEKYQPFPFKFNNETVIPQVDQDILATNYENKDFLKQSTLSTMYFETTQEELNACKRIGDNYFCKGRGVYTTNKFNLCLGALQNGSVIDVANNCKLNKKVTQEMVAQINPQTWSIYLPQPTTKYVRCPTSFELVKFRQFNLIRLPQGCELELPNHIIISGRGEPTDTNSLVLLDWNLNKTREWPVLEKDFKTRLDQSDLKLQDLHSKLEEARMEIKRTGDTTTESAKPHIGAAWTAMIIIILLALTISIYITIRRCRRKPEVPAPIRLEIRPESRGDTIQSTLTDYYPTSPPGPFYQLSQQLSSLTKCCDQSAVTYPSDKPAPNPEYPRSMPGAQPAPPSV